MENKIINLFIKILIYKFIINNLKLKIILLIYSIEINTKFKEKREKIFFFKSFKIKKKVSIWIKMESLGTGGK